MESLTVVSGSTGFCRFVAPAEWRWKAAFFNLGSVCAGNTVAAGLEEEWTLDLEIPFLA